jgi:hypothetical protein
MKEIPLGLRRPGPLSDRIKSARGQTPDDPTLEKRVDEVCALLQDLDPERYQWVLDKARFRRPWRPPHTGWMNVRDQLLHMIYGAGLLLPIVAFPGSAWGAGLMGLLAGGIREIEQYFNVDLRIEMFWDRVLDTSTFVLGTLLLYWLWT